MDHIWDLCAVLYKVRLLYLDDHQRYVNAPLRLLAHPGSALPGPERKPISESIVVYRAASLPLMAPISLLRFFFMQHGLDWPLGQVYLVPFPKELAVRSGGW